MSINCIRILNHICLHVAERLVRYSVGFWLCLPRTCKSNLDFMLPCLPEFWTAWKGADYLRTCFKYAIILKSIMKWALAIKMLIKFHNHICETTATTMDRRITGFDKGWERIGIGITKLIRNVEGSPNTQFSAEEYMMLYTTVYNMLGYGKHGFSQNLCDKCKETIRHRFSQDLCDECEETIRHGVSQKLYDKCKETIDEFNRSNVLPFLSGKVDELLLRELVQRMLIHKTFVTRLSRLFAILEHDIRVFSLPPLNKLGLSSFRDVVFMEVQANATKAVIDLIRKDRAGEQIDKLLLKNVIDIFVEIGMGDIELLDETANDYKRKAEPEPSAKTCETMFDIKAFKKSIEGLITLNYVHT